MVSKITLKRAMDESIPTFTTSDGAEYRGKNPEFRAFMNPVTKQPVFYKSEKGVPFVNLTKLRKKGVEV